MKNTLQERDGAVLWHPFTQHQTGKLPLPIVRGKGAYLYGEQGGEYLDLISSWWVNLHGHSHPKIAEAIYQQAMTLEHVLFAGFTHESAISLAEQLLKILPNGFSKIFYSDNGSSAVEIALKMAYQYWHNQGDKKRQRFVAFEKAYHGDTFGAMAVGKASGFFAPFEDLLFSVEMFPYPATWLLDEDREEKEAIVLKLLANYLEQYGGETAAVIIEPLVQGAGGMRMCSMNFLRELEKLVRAHKVLIIYDEVMTGFGRTGAHFACVKAETLPDIICFAKGITGGFLPLAATACRQEIYETFLGDQFAKALAHGHSYTANPLGCAAALASLQLLQSDITQQSLAMIEDVHASSLEQLRARGAVVQTRYCGTIAAFDIKKRAEYGSDFSRALQQQFLARGLLIRPLGNTIYLLPPYCVTKEELTKSYEILSQEIEGVII